MDETLGTEMNTGMGIEEVMKYLPHRYPFLLIDRVTDYVQNESITAIKNVTINEPFFQGHFPHYPVMPGVLLLEAMAQASCILGFRSTDLMPDDKNVYLFVGVDKVRFRQPVSPGDQLLLTAKVLRVVKGIWRFETQAMVGENLVASAELMCTMKAVKD